LWSILPWDLDLTWAEGMYGNGDDPFKTRVLYTDKRYGDVREPFHAEYQGRLREIMDLLFKTEQVGRMIDEYVALVDRPSPGPSMVDADRALWDYNPILASPHVNPSKAGHGRFYQVAATKDFPGMARRMKDYVAFVYDHARNWMGDPGNGPGLVELAFDPLIPDTPVVTAIGPAGYPSDTLRFRTSPFSALLFPFKAMQWRIAEVTDPAAPMYDPEAPMRYEVEAGWTSGQISPFVAEVEIPAGVARPGCVYRVRCRMQDITDRWSHWSDPVQFTAGPPLLDRPRLALQVTEVMYHPAASVSEDGWDQDEFEFIEFMNIGPTPIDLFGVRLEGGVEFAFAGSAVTQLAPGAYVLVVENLVAFECRYGSALLSEVAGQYEGKLANGGEDLRVVDLQTGSLADFAYDDAWYPSTDGQGQSLVLVDPEHVDPGQLGQKASWRASARWGGSPGARDGP